MTSVCVVLLACGGGEAQKPAETATQAKTERKVPEWQLGKYSTGDGMVQLIIDRTGERTKLQLRGTKDIIELTPQEVRDRGELRGTVFVAPSGARMLFVDTGGGMTYLRDRDELPLRRDGDAEPLGAATVTGAPKPPPPPEKSAIEQERERLAAFTVVGHMTGFTSEQAADPAKIAEAIEKAPKAFWMQTADEAWYAPVAYEGHNGGLGFEKEPDGGPPTAAEKQSPLAKFNAWLRPSYELTRFTQQWAKSSWPKLYEFEYRDLPTQSPVLLWELTQEHAVLVSLDGGRYLASPVSNGRALLAPGVSPKTKWPTAVRNSLLHLGSVNQLAKQGLVDKKVAADLDTAWKGWGPCAVKVFEGAKTDLDSPKADRRALLERYDAKARTTCKEFKTIETNLAKVISERDKLRATLLAKNVARLEALGFGK
jgi:hypothetical protein